MRMQRVIRNGNQDRFLSEELTRNQAFEGISDERKLS